MDNTIYDKSFFKGLMKKNHKGSKKYFKKWCSVTDLENIACAFSPKNEDEKELLIDILKMRASKLDSNFVLTEQYKKQLLELNEKIKNGFSMACNEAERLFKNMKRKIHSKDQFVYNFEMEFKVIPFFYKPKVGIEIMFIERENEIYNKLYNSLSEYFWKEDITDKLRERDSKNELVPSLRYDNDIGYNFDCFNGAFDDRVFCSAMYELKNTEILSWYDILKIRDIWIEINVTHQHFISNIGKGTFWDDDLQSLSENEAENLRQEYMSRLSKDMSGLPVEMLVDEMGAWERVGSYKRVKFQGNKYDKIDFKRMYSMSIEKEPKILVKDAQIDLSDEELQQVKNFVSKNRESLIKMSNGKNSLLDFAESLGNIKKRGNKL